MASAYPGALDTLATNKTDATSATSDHPQHHDDLADAINKIEAELGIAPRGASATVRARFEELFVKEANYASTANVAGTYANGTAGVGATKAVGGTALTVDGVAVANGDRVLLKDQTTAAENGIYTVSGVGSSIVLTRVTDSDTPAKLADCEVNVAAGAVNGDTKWRCGATAVTVGTTALPFRRTMPFYGHGNPRYPWDIGGNTAQPVMATLPRTSIAAAYSLTSTQTLVGGIVVPAGRTVSNVNFAALNTAASITILHFALVRQSDRLVMAHTANSTTVPTINAATARALTGAWTPNYDTPVWVLISHTASTALQIAAGPASNAAANLIAPAIAATNGVAASSTVPTDNSTVITAATAGIANIPYLWLT